MPGPQGSPGARKEVQELEQFERKRAAIETIFTFALLYVAGLQVWTTVYQDLNFGLAITPVVALLAVAFILGGRNLWEQIQIGIRLQP